MDNLDFLLSEYPGFVIITDQQGQVINSNGRLEKVFGFPEGLVSQEITEIDLFSAISTVETIATGEITYGSQEYNNRELIYCNIPAVVNHKQQGYLTKGLILESPINQLADIAGNIATSCQVNSSQLVMMLVDKAGKISYINQYFLSKAELDYEQVVGKYISDFFTLLSVEKDSIPTVIRAMREDRFIKTKEFFQIKTTEEMLILDITAFPLIVDDKLIGGIVWGPTRKDVIRYNEQVNQANRIENVRQMAFRVIHEIRNPFQEIIATSELGQLKANNQQVRQYFTKINKQVKKVHRLLTTNLQLFDPHQIELRELNINRLLDKIISKIQNTCQEKEIKLSTEIDNSSLIITGDQKLLLQALLNIVENAIESLEQISADKRLKIKFWATDNNFYFSIYNSGPPIPEGIEDTIFDLFSSNKGKNGAGLGLTIAYYIIVKIHQGDIWFESNQHGTVFYIKLPQEIEKIESNLDPSYKGLNGN
ncbi:ATP-binding protein [Halanaerobaculum tunisiense]